MIRALEMPLCAMLLSTMMVSCAPRAGNERLVLGARYQTASFGDGYSVLGADQQLRPRNLWASTVVVAPTDGTITGQTLRTRIGRGSDQRERAYGLYPTVESALDSQTVSWLGGHWMNADELGRSVGEILLMPYRAVAFFVTAPRSWSPERSWKRTNQQSPSAWSSAQPSNGSITKEQSHDHTNE